MNKNNTPLIDIEYLNFDIDHKMENLNLVRTRIPLGNKSIFHVILKGTYLPYSLGFINNIFVNYDKLVDNFIHDLNLKYKNNIENIETKEQLTFISNQIKYNFYLVDIKGYLIYKILYSKNTKSEEEKGEEKGENIIILSLNNNTHYELIGYQKNNENTIYFNFDDNNIYIKWLNLQK